MRAVTSLFIKRLTGLILLFTLAACSSLPSIVPSQPPPVSTNQAVLDLRKEANIHADAGYYAQAKASLERALRLEPRNAHLWFELAQVNHLDQQYTTAKNIALKAKSMTGEQRLLAEIDRFLGKLE